MSEVNEVGMRDRGFSLIELIVTVVLLGLLLAGVTTMFFGMWTTQGAVTEQTRATTRGQLISSEIEKAMRNAAGFQVTDGGSTLLVSTTLQGSRQCQSFHLVSGDDSHPGTVQMGISAVPGVAAASAPTWQTGIRFHDGAAPFTAVDMNGAPTLGTPAGVRYLYDAVGDVIPGTTSRPRTVAFSGNAYPRNLTMQGVTACWP